MLNFSSMLAIELSMSSNSAWTCSALTVSCFLDGKGGLFCIATLLLDTRVKIRNILLNDESGFTTWPARGDYVPVFFEENLHVASLVVRYSGSLAELTDMLPVNSIQR